MADERSPEEQFTLDYYGAWPASILFETGIVPRVDLPRAEG